MSRILLVSSPFFGYSEIIADGMRRLGHEVETASTFPTDNGLFRGVARSRPGWVSPAFDLHYQQLARRTAAHPYDIVLFVDVEHLPTAGIAALRTAHPSARFVLYSWDSMRNYPQVRAMLGRFDATFTFDPLDAADDARLTYLPLFYAPAYGEVGDEAAPAFDHDLLSVCTAHPSRLAVLGPLLPTLRAAGLRVSSYLYLHPLQHLNHLFGDKAFRTFSRGLTIEHTPLPQTSVVELVRRSRAVLDIQHPGQTGLTMRTFETVGAGRQLVTTNPTVLDLPFYDPASVHLLDPAQPDALVDFLTGPFTPPVRSQVEPYSLASWLTTLLGHAQLPAPGTLG